jgi:hypothetical protein
MMGIFLPSIATLLLLAPTVTAFAVTQVRSYKAMCLRSEWSVMVSSSSLFAEEGQPIIIVVVIVFITTFIIIITKTIALGCHETNEKNQTDRDLWWWYRGWWYC